MVDKGGVGAPREESAPVLADAAPCLKSVALAEWLIKLEISVGILVCVDDVIVAGAI